MFIYSPIHPSIQSLHPFICPSHVSTLTPVHSSARTCILSLIHPSIISPVHLRSLTVHLPTHASSNPLTQPKQPPSPQWHVLTQFCKRVIVTSSEPLGRSFFFLFIFFNLQGIFVFCYDILVFCTLRIVFFHQPHVFKFRKHLGVLARR